VTISFTAPNNNGGGAITSYTVTCGTVVSSGPSSPITVTGLINGMTYSCAVAAVNSAGTGPQSAAASVTPFGTGRGTTEAHGIRKRGLYGGPSVTTRVARTGALRRAVASLASWHVHFRRARVEHQEEDRGVMALLTMGVGRRPGFAGAAGAAIAGDMRRSPGGAWLA